MRSARLTQAGLFVVALALAAGVGLVGGWSFARKVDSFQPIGFAARPAGGGWLVTSVDRPQTGLAPGDQILLVDGRQPTGARELAGELRGADSRELAVLRGDALAEVHYLRPALDLDLPYLILSLIGVVYLAIGLFTLFRDRHPRSALFYLWCLASAALYLVTPTAPAVADGTGVESLQKAFYAADELARIFLPALTLHLFLVFPAPAGPARRVRRWVPFVYLPAAVLLTLQADLVLAGGRYLVGGAVAGAVRVLERVELVHLAAFAVAAAVVLALRLAREDDWERARQLRWIAVGVAGGYLPFVGLSVLPALAGISWPEPLTAAAVLPLALVPLTISYAILRYKLWDIDVIVRDTISYTLTLLLGILGFSLVSMAIQRGVPAGLSGTRVVLSFVGGLAIAGLLVPARRGIATGLERIQYRQTYRERRALAEFARELLHERDLGRLATRLLARLEDTVGTSRANLYLMQGGGLVPVYSEEGVPVPLPADALGDEVWKRDFARLSGMALPGGPQRPAQLLFAAGYRYVFPLRVRGNPIGVALISYKHEQSPLNSEDLDLIRQLLDQAALAIENAKLLDRVQQQLEEVHRLQQYSEGIIESSPAGIAVVDSRRRVVSANAAFAALVGRERHELPDEPFEELLPVRPLPEPGGGLVEISYCDPGGSERHLQLSAAAFRRGPGEDLRIVVVHDVTERVAMEAALKQKDRLAALGVLAAGVAHEVNTPITGISSYAQMLLAETPEGDPRRELLQKVERQTFRAARIVNNLLEFARNREGEMHPVELGSIVEECLDLVRERHARRRVRVDWRPPVEPLTVMGTDGELQQVITNLLLNGGDAMADQGGGVIRVALANGGERALLTVEDEGEGIPKEQLDKIFEPFFTTKLGRGGTGLGLSISYEIVHRLGGEMTVDSAPGRGTRFTVDLPLAEPARPA
jgi:signal transduction histidine kinase